MVCRDARFTNKARRRVVAVVSAQTFAVLVPVAVPAVVVVVKRERAATGSSSAPKVLPPITGGLGVARDGHVLARVVGANDVPSARGASAVVAVGLSRSVSSV